MLLNKSEMLPKKVNSNAFLTRSIGTNTTAQKKTGVFMYYAKRFANEV